MNFTNAYGLTETSSTITLLDPNDHREAISDTNLRQRLGSVGKALPSIELEIRDEDGQAVSAGTLGKSTYADLRYPVSTTVEACWTVKVGSLRGMRVILTRGAIFSSLDGQTT